MRRLVRYMAHAVAWLAVAAGYGIVYMGEFRPDIGRRYVGSSVEDWPFAALGAFVLLVVSALIVRATRKGERARLVPECSLPEQPLTPWEIVAANDNRCSDCRATFDPPLEAPRVHTRESPQYVQCAHCRAGYCFHWRLGRRPEIIGGHRFLGDPVYEELMVKPGESEEEPAA